ncbi:MAG: hypothetical protein AB7E55_04605 [Pigmentiphaga sp.]
MASEDAIEHLARLVAGEVLDGDEHQRHTATGMPATATFRR